MGDADAVAYDVIIVGAGLAGLTTARTLLKKNPGLKILVLEGKNRVGGRTLTVEMKTANHSSDFFDLGGQWVGRTQKEILELLEELNIETYEQYLEGKKMVQMGSSKIRTYSSALPIFSLNAFTLYELFGFVLNMFRFNRMADQIDVLHPLQSPNAAWANEHSVLTWARSVATSRTIVDAFQVAIRSVYGVEASRMNFLYHLTYSKSAGSFLDLLEAEGDGAQRYRIKGGSQQISEKLASSLGDRLRLGWDVREVETSEGGPTYVNVHTDDDDDCRLSCARLVLAIPPSQCAKLRFSPELPYLKRRLFENATPGHLIKFIVTYSSAFWREDGWSGEILSTGRTVVPGEIAAVVLTYDATTANGYPALVGFIHAELFDLGKSERCTLVVRDLVRFFGEKALSEFVAYEEKNWADEPLTGGCPVDYISPGNMDAFVAIRDMHYGVHFAGTETAIHWMGYMAGAVESGKRAANEVFYALEDREHVDHKYLKGSQFSGDYHPPIMPSEHYTERISPWWRRTFFLGFLVFGVYACSRKYELTLAGRAFRPAEKAIFKWWTGSEWP